MKTHTEKNQPADFGKLIALEVSRGMQVSLDATRSYVIELESINKELLEALLAMVNCFAPYKGIGEEVKEAAVKYANEIIAKAERKEP